MAKVKKAPTARMKEAKKRLAGMKSIDPNLDLGNGVSVATVEAAIDEADGSLEDYNTVLSLADQKLDIFTVDEKAVRDIDKKVLPAVGLKYGTDSPEYEMVGGTRDSERAKPVRTPKTPKA